MTRWINALLGEKKQAVCVGTSERLAGDGFGIPKRKVFRFECPSVSLSGDGGQKIIYIIHLNI